MSHALGCKFSFCSVIVTGTDLQDGHVQESAKATGTNDRAVLQEAIRDEGDLRQVLLPQAKHDKANDSDHDHGNDVVARPAFGCTGCDVQRDQDQSEAREDEQHADDWKKS